MLDIILLGATGFTGQRAAQYYRDHAPEKLTWGIAGRNKDKLNALAAELDLSEDRIIVCDATDPEQVDAMVARCRILVTTAGPFSLYGKEVVRACAQTGTHYLDITGEVDFIRSMIDAHGDEAERSGSVLVPFSGFDSVPADIGTLLSASQFDKPEELIIRSYYTISGGFNGGTIATMLNKFESGEYRKMGDPRILMHEGRPETEHVEGSKYSGFDPTIGRWTLPFIMGAINSKVVYRTAQLMADAGHPYAQKITYSEHSALGKKREPFSFFFLAIILGSLQKFGPKKWFRSLVRKIAPSPGEGPSESVIENGFFRCDVFSTDGKEHSAHLRISYPGDPGNKSTVFFLCESSLLLWQKMTTDDLPKPGFHTPVSAMGNDLADRLADRGLKTELISAGQ